MDLSVTAMATVCQHFGTIRLPCPKTAVLVKVISTALGKLPNTVHGESHCEWLLHFSHAGP